MNIMSVTSLIRASNVCILLSDRPAALGQQQSFIILSLDWLVSATSGRSSHNVSGCQYGLPAAYRMHSRDCEFGIGQDD